MRHSFSVKSTINLLKKMSNVLDVNQNWISVRTPNLNSKHGISFSRRDFLKASGAGLLGLFLADIHLERVFAVETPKQGRSTMSGIDVFNEPFFNAKKIYMLRQDEVVNISGEVEGDYGYGNPFNSTWYQLNSNGYVYSGTIQPVETLHQKPAFDIPEIGVLGEITVPFSDTRRAEQCFCKPRLPHLLFHDALDHGDSRKSERKEHLVQDLRPPYTGIALCPGARNARGPV